MVIIKTLLLTLVITTSIFLEAYNSKHRVTNSPIKNIDPLIVRVRKLNSKQFEYCIKKSPVIDNLFDIACSYKKGRTQFNVTITNVSSENGLIIDTEGSKLFYTDTNSNFKSQNNDQVHWEQPSDKDSTITNTKRKKYYYTDSNTNFNPTSSDQIRWSPSSENNQ
jgi:hypothetical protein